MTDRHRAIAIASKILDGTVTHPDHDLKLLARQFLSESYATPGEYSAAVKSRDDFLIERGLWSDYVHSLPAWEKANAARPPTPAYAITGQVTLRHTNQIPGHDATAAKCACCPVFDSHIYGAELTLPDYETHYPNHFGNRIDYWLASVFDFKKLEGRHVKLTAELLPLQPDPPLLSQEDLP